MPRRAQPFWYHVTASLDSRGKYFRRLKLKNAFTWYGLTGKSTGPFSLRIHNRTTGQDFGHLQQFVPDFPVPYTFKKGSVIAIEVANLHPAANIISFTLVGSEIV
jgi:hypothetical protein